MFAVSPVIRLSMPMTLAMPLQHDDASPFSLDDDARYRRWRDAKLAQRAA